MYYLYNMLQINNMLENIKKENKIFIYPAGRITEILLEILDKKKINIDGLIDKEKKLYFDYPIYTVDILKKFKEATVIITSRKYEREIRETISNIKEFNGEILTAFLEKEENIYFYDLENDNRLCMERMDLVLTSRCTLKCEKCANLMQYYKVGKDVPIDMIYESMKKLLTVIDFIGTIYVLGGEPFLYNYLKEVLIFLKSYKNIGQIEVVTNGTILIKDIELWKEMQDSRVVLSISNYGSLSKYKDELIQCCKTYYINYKFESDNWFYDTGDMKKRNRSNEVLQNIFHECGTKCRSLYMGELHYCPRSAHGMDLTRIKGNYVNLLSKMDNNELKMNIKRLISRKDYIEACDYCDIRVGDYYKKKYPAGVQAVHVLEV